MANCLPRADRTGPLRFWRVADFSQGRPRIPPKTRHPLLQPFLSSPPYQLGNASTMVQKVSQITGLELIGTDAVPKVAPPR